MILGCTTLINTLYLTIKIIEEESKWEVKLEDVD